MPYSTASTITHPLSIDAITKLRSDLATVPAVPIEKAAELLQMSVRTLYRRKEEFEYLRRKGHLYFTLRSIEHHIATKDYFATPLFDATSRDTIVSFDARARDNKKR